LIIEKFSALQDTRGQLPIPQKPTANQQPIDSTRTLSTYFFII